VRANQPSRARTENLRRVAHVAALFCQEGFVTVAATISPEVEHRANARQIIGDARFIEVFVDTPLAVCEERDPKGLYRRARNGEIPEFTGIGSPYHAPLHPDLTLHTQGNSIDRCVDQIVKYLVRVRRFNPGLIRAKAAVNGQSHAAQR
jgi:adenylylsulfate kinase